MSRIALPVPTANLVEAFSKWPMPWSIRQTWATPISGGRGADIIDANGSHVLMCEEGLARGIVSLTEVAWVLGVDLPVDRPINTLTNEGGGR